MKTLLILPPTAEKSGYVELPLGLLYAGTAMNRAGYNIKILDLQANYMSADSLLAHLKSNDYGVVGFGGISTCYGYVKQASRLIRESLPDIHLMAGGVLSSTYELLLKNTPIDVICMKEGETTGVNILNRLKSGKRYFEDIPGVAFKKDGKPFVTPTQQPIRNIDDVGLPEYSLIDIEKYLASPLDDLFFMRNKECRSFYKRGMFAFNIKTSRGCTNACAFCYRHFVGHRQHSVCYVINHINYLRQKYNVHFFHFGDELFTQNKKWVLDFCDSLIEENIKIFFVVHGVRTENVDNDILKALKTAGCVAVFVGFESGSQKVLDQMRKNVSAKRNTEAVKMVVANGIEVLVQAVLGMPCEDDSTVEETKNAVIETGVGFENLCLGYAQAYPMTWLWGHAVSSGLINDEGGYLESAGACRSHIINYTKIPDEKWRTYSDYVYREVIKHQFRRSGPLLREMMVRHHKFRWMYVYYRDLGLKGLVRKALKMVAGKAAGK